jgi:hypothetical protein
MHAWSLAVLSEKCNHVASVLLCTQLREETLSADEDSSEHDGSH